MPDEGPVFADGMLVKLETVRAPLSRWERFWRWLFGCIAGMGGPGSRLGST